MTQDEKTAQKIVDLFFDAGAKVSQAHYEYVLVALLAQRASILAEERAKFIADLYVCRSKMVRPLGYRELQDPQEILQYNWMNTIISNLSDKYNVKYAAVKEALSTLK